MSATLVSAIGERPVGVCVFFLIQLVFFLHYIGMHLKYVGPVK